MSGGNLVSFNDNFADNSSEAGFQFTFYCDNCHEGYKTRFEESKTYKKKRLFKGIGRIASAASSLAGTYNIGAGIDRGASALSEKFEGMSPLWHKEHEGAFEKAQNEAKGNFHRCPHCTRWICDNCWNEQAGLCIGCAPRENVEIAAAKASATKDQIWEKAQESTLFTGKVEDKVTICPVCGKPAGSGKFCINCGAPLKMIKCPKCGAENPPGTNFCGECGSKLI